MGREEEEEEERKEEDEERVDMIGDGGRAWRRSGVVEEEV